VVACIKQCGDAGMASAALVNADLQWSICSVQLFNLGHRMIYALEGWNFFVGLLHCCEVGSPRHFQSTMWLVLKLQFQTCL
jgi:hypothetical protein